MPQLLPPKTVQARLDTRLRDLVGSGGTPPELEEDAALAVRVFDSLRSGRVRLVCLPALDCSNGAVMFEEVLLRLFDHDYNVIPVFPALMCLQRWNLLADVTPFLVKMQLAHGHALVTPISVNIPPAALADGEQRVALHQVLEGYTKQHGTHHGTILEITETAYVDPTPDLVAYMHDMKKLGFRWALDDFGDGFHTFDHLSLLPLDLVKLSRDVSRLLVSHTSPPPEVALAMDTCRMLGLELVAEHINSIEEAKDLHTNHQVHYAQVFGGVLA